jgi:hypothetical protein
MSELVLSKGGEGGARPRISLVVATFNRRPLLERLLQQLEGQTLPPAQFEVVVVDDGSQEPGRAPDRLTTTCAAPAEERRRGEGAAPGRAPGARGYPVIVTTTCRCRRNSCRRIGRALGPVHRGAADPADPG